MKNNDVPYFSTGSDLLDMVVGGAPNVFGYPAGKFINIVGDKSAGKTFLANEMIAAAYWKYGKDFRWVYDDCESGYSFDTVEMYGFQIAAGDGPHSDTIERAFCNISDFAESLKKGQFGIYVIDSLDGLTSREADKQARDRLKAHKQGKEYDEGSYNMGKPRYLSREFFPQLCGVVQDKNILVVIISQVRENIDMFSFEKFKRNGGKALDFYAHTVLWLATMKKVVKKGRSVGVVVKAKVTKSKTPRPFRECLFTLLFDYGLDNTGTSLDFLFDLRTDKGELQAAAKSIAWGGEGEAEKPNVLKIKKFLKSQLCPIPNPRSGPDRMSDAMALFMRNNVKVSLDKLLDFIGEHPGLEEAYKKEHGAGGAVVMSRENLIRHIEGDEAQAKTLYALVHAKWESVEAGIRSNRRKRYGTQPKGGDA